MATPQQKLEAGVEKACALQSTAIVTTDHVTEAWAALRTGVLAARRLAEVLDARSAEEMRSVLELALRRASQKRAAIGQVRECLRILLARPPWLTAASAEERFQAGVREALDAGQDAELLAQLDAAEAAAVAAEGAGAEEAADAAGVDEGQPRPVGIRECLAHGRAVLERFGWEFPSDPVGTQGDQAVAGFMHIVDALTALETASGRASVGGEPAAVLVELEEDWPGLLRFLLGLYGCGVRRTYVARVRFVVVRLRALAPAFRDLAPWASLPWGDLPMPEEEAEAEARQLEELGRRRKEEEVEAEDQRLARELQLPLRRRAAAGA